MNKDNKDKKVKKTVDSILLRVYNNMKDVEAWYDRPHYLLGRQHMNGKDYTPGEMFEVGDGQKVLDLLKFLTN